MNKLLSFLGLATIIAYAVRLDTLGFFSGLLMLAVLMLFAGCKLIGFTPWEAER